ncbi:MAG: radical SAM family heme chaperone HemW [Bacteroidia bacterium]|nr:radical SAM family heme chaperone HemW [Bacteroidia bacterium]
MPGLYFHIPFCRKACTYCDFHFVTQLRGKAAMTAAMRDELTRRYAAGYADTVWDTVYLGGGTPSVLDLSELDLLLTAVRSGGAIRHGAEITLEANPDDMRPEQLAGWQSLGINRLSVGIQSFSDTDLRWMNRSHTGAEAAACVRLAREAGFRHLSLDLIFGLPGLSDTAWEENIRHALDLRPDHLSVYSLTVEDKTALAHQVRQGQTLVPPEDAYARQFMLAHDLLTAAGYIHYEISNYALPGCHARHNSAYWAGEPYLGIGPAAHAYDGRYRWWNHANNARYLKALTAGTWPEAARELLSAENQYHEYIITRLRTHHGISLPQARSWVPDWDERFMPSVRDWMALDLVTLTEDTLRATPAGWMVADALATALFL